LQLQKLSIYLQRITIIIAYKLTH